MFDELRRLIRMPQRRRNLCELGQRSFKVIDDFRSDNSRWLAVQEEEVIDPPVGLLKGELPDSDSHPCTQVELVLALDQPACLGELLVDFDPGQCLSGQVAVLVGTSLIRHAGQITGEP